VPQSHISSLKSLLLLCAHLHDVRLEENMPDPVYNHIDLAPDGGNLHQVDASPEKPREQTGEFEIINFRRILKGLPVGPHQGGATWLDYYR